MITLGALTFTRASEDTSTKPIDAYISIRVGTIQYAPIYVRGDATAKQIEDLLLGLLSGAADRARQPAEVFRVEVEDGLREHVVEGVSPIRTLTPASNDTGYPVLRLGPGGDFSRDISDISGGF